MLDLTTIYPNEINDNEGRSVEYLGNALEQQNIEVNALVLRPWAPGWLSRIVKKWNHLGVKPRIQFLGQRKVVFDNYFHLPRGYRLEWSAISMANRAKYLIKKNSLSYDVIHGQSIYPASLAACELASAFRIPFIITLRDDLSHLDHMLDVGSDRLRRQYKIMFEKVNAIFVHGPALLREIVKYIPTGRNIPVVMATNGVDVSYIEKAIADKPPRKPQDWGSIISVSNLYRFKGIHENLQALKIISERGITDWRYTIIGDGPYRIELEDLARSSGLTSKVEFRGRVSRENTLRAISDADIFALPSWLEPFGNVYAEAAVCGKPVIGCVGQGAEVTVQHGKTGLLVPGKNAAALADALEYLLSNPGEARMMGQRGRENVGQFTWDRTAKIYRDTIEQVVLMHRS